MINTVIIAPNNVNVVGVVDSHPSNLKPLVHVFKLTFIVVGVPEQSFDPVYLLSCICPLIQVAIIVDVFESPTQTPGKLYSFVCISPLQSVFL